MIIRNRTFFVAENVSAAHRQKLTREILLRGGRLTAEPDEKTDYEIFDAEKEYPADTNRSARVKAVRITVNEMTRILDESEPPAQTEFSVVNGVLERWIPEESDSTVLRIPERVRRIRGSAFCALFPIQESVFRKRKKMIKKIVFPKSLEVIEKDAFRDFRSLTVISFQKGLKSLNGFRGCVKLNGISIPKTCTEIGEEAFYGCTGLNDVEFSANITSIGKHAFYRCGLTVLHTWESLSDIGAYAFAYCRNLNSISFESGQLVCEKNAFKGSDMNRVEVSDGNVSVFPSSFSALTMAVCLEAVKSGTCNEGTVKMWKEMMLGHSAAFNRRLDNDLLSPYREFCRAFSGLPLKGRDDDITDPFMLEALKRIRILQKQTGLNPKVQKYYRKGRLYYSYLTAHGFIGSIDTISYNPVYERIVREAEAFYGIHVYHVIESYEPFGCLILLYVGEDPAEWEYARPQNGLVPAYVHNFELGEGEFGDVLLSSYGRALVRVG